MGDSAIAAFHEIRGDNYARSDSVPVQNLAGAGVWNGHWRELVFRSELMTPFIDKGLNPLSAVSIASLIDVGYEGVDLSVADEYVLPPSLYGGDPHGIGDPAAPTHLGDDILRIPLMVVDRDGAVVRVIQPPGR